MCRFAAKCSVSFSVSCVYVYVFELLVPKRFFNSSNMSIPHHENFCLISTLTEYALKCWINYLRYDSQF